MSNKKSKLCMPQSPRKWPLTSPKLGVMVLVLMVSAILLLNLEAFFPYSSAADRKSDDELHQHQRHRRHRHDDLHWPGASYLMSSSWQEQRRQHKRPGQLGSDAEVFSCDRSHKRTDVCHLKGDVRMHSRSASFFLHARNKSTPIGEEVIKPYTRKWEQSCMDLVHEVKLKSVAAAAANSSAEDECEVRHSVPAVVFTTGGYTGNVYHEFHDGLIPLYITSQHLKGEVVFIGVEFHNWWLTKYSDVVGQMSNYPIIDFDKDQRVHCFPEVTVGLHIHDELTVDPALMPHNESIVDFRKLLDAAYSQDSDSSELTSNSAVRQNGTGGVPRLLIIVRNDTRVILNLEEVVEEAKRVGFEVEILKPDRTSELRSIYRALNSSDVLLGVHGAAMTHFLFMRPGSVFIQIIPLGTKWAASAYYGEPAQKLGLHYFGYEIMPEESSLSDKYDKSSLILTDPSQVIQKGWSVVKQIYLESQDVRLSIPRFRTTLTHALDASSASSSATKHSTSALSSSS